ncbi:MAG: serine hydrolase [Aggregatilineales bacterium]
MTHRYPWHNLYTNNKRLLLKRSRQQRFGAVSLRLVLLLLLFPSHSIQGEDGPQTRAKALSAQLKSVVGVRKLGIAVLPINASDDAVGEVGVNDDDQYSVASAFKGPVAIYFFENVGSEVWRSYPIRYWNDDDEEDVPEAYKPAWERYHVILRAVYQMAVYSENDSTGNVLAYVYDSTGKPAQNAIIGFNDWGRSAVGISGQSGLNAWFAGKSSCARGCSDPRFGQVQITYRHKIVLLGNSYSPHDLARFYTHLATQGRVLGYYDTAMALLSVGGPDSSLSKADCRPQGVAVASKSGLIGPYIQDSNGFYVTTDAGIFTLPDGEQYAFAFMALDAGDLLPNVLGMTCSTLLQAMSAFF